MAVKEFVGTVVSDKAINTRVVAVNDRIQHNTLCVLCHIL